MNATATAPATRTPVVLLAEDDENQVMLTELALEKAGVKADLHVVADGVECMEFLERSGRHAAAPAPDLLLLDLHMPRMDGREVMTRIAASESLRSLPVVVLTTSTNQEDVDRMYELRCSSYVVKPVEFQQFVETARQLGRYWFELATLPSPRDPT